MFAFEGLIPKVDNGVVYFSESSESKIFLNTAEYCL